VIIYVESVYDGCGHELISADSVDCADKANDFT